MERGTETEMEEDEATHSFQFQADYNISSLVGDMTKMWAPLLKVCFNPWPVIQCIGAALHGQIKYF